MPLKIVERVELIDFASVAALLLLQRQDSTVLLSRRIGAAGPHQLPTFSVEVRPLRQANIESGVILPVRGFVSIFLRGYLLVVT